MDNVACMIVPDKDIAEVLNNLAAYGTRFFCERNTTEDWVIYFNTNRRPV